MVDFAPEGVPYAAILPPHYEKGGPIPLCLVLHGGGGTHQNLVDSKPIYDELWASGALPPMVLASASISPLGFYLDHPGNKVRWETFIARDFIAHLRRTYKVGNDRNSTIITGISMGGHGSLRIAFRNPDRFAAVAVLEPAVDPALRLDDVTERNHFFYPPVLKSGGMLVPTFLSVPAGTRNYSRPTIPPVSRLRMPMRFAKAVLQSISKPATTMCSTFMTARSFFIVCCGTWTSRTNIIWSAAPIT